MEIKEGKKFQLLFLLIGLFLFLPIKTQAWDTNITHPHLTAEAVAVFNQEFDNQLTSVQKEWIIQGSVREDTPLRWMNHFYDPVYNTRGFKGMWSNALDWSLAYQLQKNYALGDNSWQRALWEYKKGNEEQAFLALGQVLHLVQDMSVPAHTRDDAHPTGDSLEQFVKYNWTEIKPYLRRSSFKSITSLYDVFVDEANYSNQSFYSDDTVESAVSYTHLRAHET